MAKHRYKCWITEFFSCYIVNIVNFVRSIIIDNDYFLWGHPKNFVARVSVAASSVREMLCIFECVRQLLH